MHFEAGQRILGGKGVVELREQSAGEAEHSHNAILHALPAHSAMRGHRADRKRLFIEDKSERVGVVDRDVQHDAPARRWLVDSPALQVGRQINRVKHPRKQRLADPAQLDRIPHRPVRGGVAKMMIGAQDHAASATFGNHRARVSKCQSQRLLTENMLPRPGRRENLVSVKLIGRRNVNRVDFVRSDQILQARRRVRDSMLLRKSGCAIRVRAHDRDDFPIVDAEGIDHVLRGNCAGSHEPPAECRHGCAPNKLRLDVPQDSRTIRVVGHRTVSGAKSPLAI